LNEYRYRAFEANHPLISLALRIPGGRIVGRRKQLDQKREPAGRLEAVQWHIIRADGQRSGLWSRASALLSANTLVVGGAAILVTGAGTRSLSLLVTLLPLTAAIISIYFASTVVRSGVASEKKLTEGLPKRPSVYSLTDVASKSGNFEAFKGVLPTRSVEMELEDATVELWRLSVLHERRMKQLGKSLQWFVAGSALLFGSAITVLAGLVFR
jgi:hypothetical protein